MTTGDLTSIGVLIVDDDQASRFLLRRMIERFEDPWFLATECGSLSEAFPIVMGGDVQLILLDLGLPESSGVSTVDRVRAVAKGTPIIAVTGANDLGVACIEAGATDYLDKATLTPRAVRRAMVFALERHHRETADDLRDSIARHDALVERRSWDPAPTLVPIGVGTPGVRGILDDAYRSLMEAYAGQLAGSGRVPRAKLEAVAATFAAVRASSDDVAECNTRFLRRTRARRPESELELYIAATRELGLDLLGVLAENYRRRARRLA